LDTLNNIPKSRVKGAELEAVWAPITGLRLQAAGTYLDARVIDYVGFDSVAGVPNRNFSGAAFPFTPKWSFTGNVDYTFAVSSNGSAFLGDCLLSQQIVSLALDGSATED
jgi:iron complex outermembrane recepter protein